MHAKAPGTNTLKPTLSMQTPIIAEASLLAWMRHRGNNLVDLAPNSISVRAEKKEWKENSGGFDGREKGIGEKNDLLVGISTSGNSANIIAALKQAKFKGLKTILFTGKTGGKMAKLADVTIFVPSENTQRIQECHIMIGQIICGLIEKKITN